jgi:hypothetical protein
VEVLANLKELQEKASEGYNLDALLAQYSVRSELAIPIALVVASVGTYAHSYSRLGVSKPVCHKIFQTGIFRGLGKEIYEHIKEDDFKEGLLSYFDSDDFFYSNMLDKLMELTKTPAFCKKAMEYKRNVDQEIDRRIRVYREAVQTDLRRSPPTVPCSQKISMEALSKSVKAIHKEYTFTLNRPDPTCLSIRFVTSKDSYKNIFSTINTLKQKLKDCLTDQNVKLCEDEENNTIFIEGNDVTAINQVAYLLSDASGQELDKRYPRHSFFNLNDLKNIPDEEIEEVSCTLS